ncbi:PREDICTED: uncharacterized protein LOC106807890 [Priapulus caudatus]|uniref:Uncharacterized protein LOC106807890 n=1 Tax=Priapulus caudatus TaxID=37621 RepID=A0ABM1E109_PRICU|nr:PREDICTED: uncharacterized protein LOC106807890 [Priapulus caudatus]
MAVKTVSGWLQTYQEDSEESQDKYGYSAPLAFSTFPPGGSTRSRRDRDDHSGGKPKRVRTSFTDEQTRVLQTHFSRNQNPIGDTLEKIALQIGHTRRVTQIWFQNARAKVKRERERAQGGGNGSSTPRKVSSHVHNRKVDPTAHLRYNGHSSPHEMSGRYEEMLELKPLRCHMCSEIFTNGSSFQQHMMLIHAQNQPPGHGADGRNFSDESGDVMSHSDESNHGETTNPHETPKPHVEDMAYRCDICFLIYNDWCSFEHHRQTHESDMAWGGFPPLGPAPPLGPSHSLVGGNPLGPSHYSEHLQDFTPLAPVRSLDDVQNELPQHGLQHEQYAAPHCESHGDKQRLSDHEPYNSTPTHAEIHHREPLHQNRNEFILLPCTDSLNHQAEPCYVPPPHDSNISNSSTIDFGGESPKSASDSATYEGNVKSPHAALHGSDIKPPFVNCDILPGNNSDNAVTTTMSKSANRGEDESYLNASMSVGEEKTEEEKVRATGACDTTATHEDANCTADANDFNRAVAGAHHHNRALQIC